MSNYDVTELFPPAALRPACWVSPFRFALDNGAQWALPHRSSTCVRWAGRLPRSLELIAKRLLQRSDRPVALHAQPCARGTLNRIFSHRAASAHAAAFKNNVDGPAKVLCWVDGRFEYAVSGGYRVQHAVDRRARGDSAVDPKGIRVIGALRHRG